MAEAKEKTAKPKAEKRTPAKKKAPAKAAAAATSAGKRCRMEGCKRPYRAKGYCNVHYRAWRTGELPKPRYKTCTKEGCHKRRFQGSLCQEHAKGGAAAAPAAEPAPAA